jgi:hypothetical protein
MKILDTTIEAFGERTPVTLQAETYDNGRLALQFWTKPTEDEPFAEPFGTATVNMPNNDCPEGEIWVKDWSKNESWALKTLLDNDIIQPGGCTAVVPTGYVNVKRYKLTASFVTKMLQAVLKEGRA